MNNKINEVRLGGYVSHADIRTGQYGPYGPATIAIDDGYRDPKSGQWVDRTQFIRVELSGEKTPAIKKGDYLEISGKLVFESWEQGGESRSGLKVKVACINVHMPAEAIACLKQSGFANNPQGRPQQSKQPQRPQQTSRRQQPQQPQQHWEEQPQQHWEEQPQQHWGNSQQHQANSQQQHGHRQPQYDGSRRP
ncbi:single-stranded DNA-binding protein [Aeromonas caviae]|jgi:single-stranded DNA-binding protein|nr:single-stranded DNA-binding protein [Aeromonas caviae]